MGLWIPSSSELLSQAETAVLRCVKSVYQLRDVLIELPSKGHFFSRNSSTQSYNIRTISFCNHDKQDSSSSSSSASRGTQLPLVMVHGFASGLGLWILNYDTLSRKVPLHALDLLGFANSSRAYTFSKHSQTCIDEYVESLEKWRQAMQLDKFVLLGHSFGGYLSFFYMLKHPNRVQHLILADPWGEFACRDIPKLRLKSLLIV